MRAADEAALPTALFGPEAASERPTAGAVGNSACGIDHCASVAVPCSVCGVDDGESSRLAFFDLTIPHFGNAELVSFSCDKV